jgi:hypothetical protein
MSSLADRVDALSTDDSRSMASVLCSAVTVDWFDKLFVDAGTGAIVCCGAWPWDWPVGKAEGNVRDRTTHLDI